MSIGVIAPPVRLLRTNLRTGALARLVAVVTAMLAGTTIGLEFVSPVHIIDPTGRAAIETALTVLAVVTAGLLAANFRVSRRLPDLLLLCALAAVSLADFAYCAVPALTGGAGPEPGGAARLACDVIVSLAFAAAAFAPLKLLSSPRHRLIGVAVATGASIVMLAELLERATGSRWEANHLVGLAVNMAAAGVLLLSALAFVSRSKREGRFGLLAGASFLLAAARLQYLVMPVVGTNWITPREGLRIVAYALVLASAYWQHAKARHDQAMAAISSERERIARDLHDGLAQDLACIAAQGQRLGYELQPEHPLMVAARRALATSRGIIADLAASTAPSTEAALRLVADELEHRYGLQVEIQADTETARAANDDLDFQQRDHVVRIAREAIVNAALHGGARHVDVLLLQRGRDLLIRVSDDGCGTGEAQTSGLGSRMMRARAACLNSQLTTHPRPGGGTELELVVP